MSSRPSKHEYFMKIAEATALRSHDAQTKVGCLLVKNGSGQIVGTGYNGFVRGADDSILPTTRPEKYSYIIHSEMNLLASLARSGGVGTDDTTLYCTLSPCEKCMRHLYQAGITSVIVKSKYSDFEKLKEMKDLKINEEITLEGYHKLTYQSHK